MMTEDKELFEQYALTALYSYLAEEIFLISVNIFRMFWVLFL